MSHKTKWLVLLLLIASAASFASNARGLVDPEQLQSESEQTSEALIHQLIVKYRTPKDTIAQPSSQQNQARALEARLARLNEIAPIPLTLSRIMTNGALVVRLSKGVSAEEAEQIAAQLSLSPEIEYAEPDYILQPHTLTPNDPEYSEQWHYFDTYGINLPQAWEITRGNSNVIVAVIDSGHRPHPDLQSRIIGGYDFVTDPSRAGDGDGRDPDPTDPGDFCDGSRSSWHGTHVAGTIGAVTNNGLGVAGVTWDTRLLSVRVLGRCGGALSDLIDAIRWAAGLEVAGIPRNTTPARVLNLSLGGGFACSSSLQEAIHEINAAGAIIVVSAGNSNAPASTEAPASCEGVITVGATNRYGVRSFYSNYGPLIDVSAPGGDLMDGGVLSTDNAGATLPGEDTYKRKIGTSMAAPHVAGVVALMLALDPSLNYTRTEALLKATAKPFAPNHSCVGDFTCGAGIVDAHAALRALLPQQQPPGAFQKETPANNADEHPLDVVLAWTRPSGFVNHFRYCLGTSPCQPQTSVGRDTSVVVQNLNPGTTYFWQVRACADPTCTVYTEADSGRIYQFTTQRPDATAVRKLTPKNGATRVALTTTLVWQGEAPRYRYWVWDAEGVVVPTATTPLTQSQIGGLQPGRVYFWQVQACEDTACQSVQDADGGTPFRFSTAFTPVPFLKRAPAAQAISRPIQLNLRWLAGGDLVDHYRFCLGVTPTLCTPSLPVFPPTATAQIVDGLTQAETYAWQVRACSDPACTVYTDANNGAHGAFTTAQQPRAFAKLFPLNGTVIFNRYVTLTVQPADGAIGYAFCFDTQPGCVPRSIGATPIVTHGPLSVGTTFYWQARACGDVACTVYREAEGGYWQFSIAPPPQAFSKIAPANGASELSSTVTLEWEAVPGVDHYRYCYTNELTCIPETSAGATNRVTISGLQAGANYLWRVRACADAECTIFTEANAGRPWTFTVRARSDSFSKLYPANQAKLPTGTVVLQWSALAGANHYRYCLTTNSTSCSPNVSVGTATQATFTITNTNFRPVYWQVRACLDANCNRYVDADSGQAWSLRFTPFPFLVKTDLSDSKTPLSVGFTWLRMLTYPVVDHYRLCYSTNSEGCVPNIVLTDVLALRTNIFAAPVEGLLPNTTYVWQVHACLDHECDTYYAADYGKPSRFTTVSLPPPFGKATPPNGSSVQQPVRLQWTRTGENPEDYVYYYCYSEDARCTPNRFATTQLSVYVYGLRPGATYRWHVRACDGIVGCSARREADEGQAWSFTTEHLPTTFSKRAPVNEAEDRLLEVRLEWEAVPQVHHYRLCYSTESTCEPQQNVGPSTSVVLTGLQPSTTYTWQVRACADVECTTFVDADNRTPWRFRTGSLGVDGSAPGSIDAELLTSHPETGLHPRPLMAHLGEPFTLTVRLVNAHAFTATVHVSLALPTGIETLTATGLHSQNQPPALSWNSVVVPPNTTKDIDLRVRVNAQLQAEQNVRLEVSDANSTVASASGIVLLQPRTYLPLILHRVR